MASSVASLAQAWAWAALLASVMAMASPTLAVARAAPVIPVRFVVPPVARQVLARASQAELHVVLARLAALLKSHDFQSHFGLGQCFGAPAPASQSWL